MALTNDQLRLLDSCPVLSGLKDWIIAVDNSVNPTTVTPSTNDDSQESTGNNSNDAPNDDETQESTGDGTG
ncbi:hypothetical protein [Methanobrevibacter sp.]